MLPVQPRVSTTAAEAASVDRVCAGLRPDASSTVRIRPWEESDQAAASELVPSAYTVRSDPNPDWYGSPNGLTAVQNFFGTVVGKQSTFPFLPEASVAAIHVESGRLCGFLLGCHAMEGVAYANYLCVANWAAVHRLGDRLSVAHCLALALARVPYCDTAAARRTIRDWRGSTRGWASSSSSIRLSTSGDSGASCGDRSRPRVGAHPQGDAGDGIRAVAECSRGLDRKSRRTRIWRLLLERAADRNTTGRAYALPTW